MFSKIKELLKASENNQNVEVAKNNKPEQNNQEYFKNQLNASINDTHGKKNKTALHKAITGGNIDLITTLIEHDADMFIADNLGNTPFHLAAASKNPEILSLMLKRLNNNFSKLDAQNSYGETPLHLAVEARSAENVKELLAAKVRVDLTTNTTKTCKVPNSLQSSPNNCTALHYALIDNDFISPEIIEMLVNAGSDVNAKNFIADSPLFLAYGHAKADQITNIRDDMLVKSLEQVRKQNITSKETFVTLNTSLLHIAARNNAIDIEAFTYIVGLFNSTIQPYNPSINELDNVGKAALHIAVISGNIQKTRLLINQKNIRTNVADVLDNQPVNYAAKEGNTEMVKLFKGQYLNNEYGRKAVKESLLNNHIDTTIELIKIGAQANVKLHPAKRKSKVAFSTSSFSETSSYGPYDAENKTGFVIVDGDTPLHFAIRSGNEELVKKCLQRNPEMISATNNKGRTPAYYAVKHLSSKMANILWQAYNAVIDPKEESLLLQSATRGFKSTEDLQKFFTDPTYQLSETQAKIKEDTSKKYMEKVQENRNSNVNVNSIYL